MSILTLLLPELSTVVATLKGHRSDIIHLSFHESGQFMASTSRDRVVVWNTQAWSRRRTLDNTDVTQATFSPNGVSVLTCVATEGIVAWDTRKFRMQYRLPSPKAGTISSTDVDKFALSSDGRYVLGAGNSPNLFLWEAHILALLRIAEMPNTVSFVKQIDFLPDSDVAVALGDDGSLVIFNVLSLKVLLSIQEAHKVVVAFAIGSGGRYTACTMSDGTVALYDLDKAFASEEARCQQKISNGMSKKDAYRYLGLHPVFGSEEARIPCESGPRTVGKSHALVYNEIQWI